MAGAFGRALQALHAASRAAAAAAGTPAAAINVGPALLQACAALSPAARAALAFCRRMLNGAAAGQAPEGARGGWADVLGAWAAAAELAADDTPALALHLWTRIQPQVLFPACCEVSLIDTHGQLACVSCSCQSTHA